jgi:hypothetical protein
MGAALGFSGKPTGCKHFYGHDERSGAKSTWLLTKVGVA